MSGIYRLLVTKTVTRVSSEGYVHVQKRAVARCTQELHMSEHRLVKYLAVSGFVRA